LTVLHVPHRLDSGCGRIEREFFIGNLLVRIHLIIVMIRWTGLAPWKFDAGGYLVVVLEGNLLPIVDHHPCHRGGLVFRLIDLCITQL